MANNDAPPAVVVTDPGGCAHYRRKCDVKATCCGGWFTCHLCHDQHFQAQFPVQDGTCLVEMKGTTEGTAGRYLVEEVRCKVCLVEQPVAAACKEPSCAVPFAEYFCAPCRLYSTPSSAGIFHCDKCGICRVGSESKFFHCDKCEACYTIASKGNHVCVERALQSDCPVCMEYLFTSREALFIGPNCGHGMHPNCFQQYLRSGHYTCPTCQKPLVDLSAVTVARGAGIHLVPSPQAIWCIMVALFSFVLCREELLSERFHHRWPWLQAVGTYFASGPRYLWTSNLTAFLEQRAAVAAVLG